jgi:hypothetical protein
MKKLLKRPMSTLNCLVHVVERTPKMARTTQVEEQISPFAADCILPSRWTAKDPSEIRRQVTAMHSWDGLTCSAPNSYDPPGIPCCTSRRGASRNGSNKWWLHWWLRNSPSGANLEDVDLVGLDGLLRLSPGEALFSSCPSLMS